MNLIYFGLTVCFLINLWVLYITLHIWYGQKKAQRVRYWYDEAGKLQFDLDDEQQVWYNTHMKEVKVQMTLEWVFDKKAWSEEKTHLENLEATPSAVLGYDIINSLFVLNELDYPSAKNIKVNYAN